MQGDLGGSIQFKMALIWNLGMRKASGMASWSCAGLEKSEAGGWRALPGQRGRNVMICGCAENFKTTEK